MSLRSPLHGLAVLALLGSAAVAPTMPGWIGTLSPAQIDEIAGYLRTIAPAGAR